MITGASFTGDEMRFTVEGWQYIEDELAMESGCEIDGDYFHEVYDNFDDAVKKYMELKEKGWEKVKLLIDSKVEQNGITFLFSSFEEVMLVHVDVSKINKRMSDVLDKIRDALNSL